MRVLFVFKDIEEENLGVMYLSGMLKRFGHTVDVVEAEYDIIARRLNEGPRTVLAFSTLALYSTYYRRLSKQIKDGFDVFSIFGGHHATAVPELIAQEGVDAVCIGEGDHPLTEIVNGIEAGGDITKIQNVWVKENGRIHKNTLRPLIRDLDALPFPDRTLFTRKAPFFIERISVVTSRGCAYSCPYCYNSTLRRLYPQEVNLLRRRSVDNVIAEIREVMRQQPVRFVLFLDDIFTLLPEWVAEFAEKYRKTVNVPFNCNIRIDTIIPPIVQQLKAAGCYSISFGLESGDDVARKKILERNIDRQRILANVALLKKQGIKIRTTNIIGTSPDSLEADIRTIRLNIQCKADLAKVGTLAAYPNTDIGIRYQNLEQPLDSYRLARAPLCIRVLGHISCNSLYLFARKTILFERELFPQKNASELRAYRNFHRLFPLAVGFPFLLPFIKYIIRLPSEKFFGVLNYLWDTYCSYFRIYNTGIVSFVRSLLMYHRNARRRGGAACEFRRP